MPSTYSPDLRIELIATGEQSGTWGTTTNTNLGTLIEDAIAGYVSVSITSANQALTANNGAADQARNMVVNLTTTTTANFNVYVPPANKVYVIRNSSAYEATIYCSTVIGNTTAAGTGVAIPAGRETIVFADGTNINYALDYLLTATIGTLILTNALGVAQGGTGQTSYVNGELLIGNTTGNTLAKATLTGTSNQITVTNGAGSITLSTPQSIGTASSVQFGSFGVGTAASGTTGEIRATNNVTAFFSSDRTLKENIRDIPDALNKACAIGGKLFDWTDDYIAKHGGADGYFVQKADFGVIAQDVQEQLPVAVRKREDGTLAVDYEKMCALAFAAIAELRAEVEALKKGN